MNIIHRINANNKPLFKEDLDSLGVKYRYTESIVGKWIFFEISENNHLWPEVSALIEKHDLGLHMVRTEFTVKELKNAVHQEIGTTWHHGYPMPDDDFGYREITYDLSEYCPNCGIGKKQNAPFRMINEPKWGRKHILALNWIYDELFVLPEVWETTFKPFDIGYKKVLKHKTGIELKTVVQLDVQEFATSELKTSNLPYEVCSDCNRKKYLPIARGFFPAFCQSQKGHLFKTKEYFGSGASAHHAVIVSAELYQEIKKNKLKGVTFTPLENKVCASCNL